MYILLFTAQYDIDTWRNNFNCTVSEMNVAFCFGLLRRKRKWFHDVIFVMYTSWSTARALQRSRDAGNKTKETVYFRVEFVFFARFHLMLFSARLAASKAQFSRVFRQLACCAARLGHSTLACFAAVRCSSKYQVIQVGGGNNGHWSSFNSIQWSSVYQWLALNQQTVLSLEVVC